MIKFETKFLDYNIYTMTGELIPTSLENLKEENRRLKEELEIARLEAENREMREEISRLRNPYSPWTTIYTPTPGSNTYIPRPRDNMTLCNNQQ